MKTVWEKMNEETLQQCMEFNEGYKQYISDCKTERECVQGAIALAEKAGYRPYDNGPLQANDKVYFVNRGKSICLYNIGTEPLEKGLNILGAHIDSPRIDLKQKPLYEADGLALFDTHYYGGVKKYQWIAQPMALHGVVCKKDGTTINIVIGEDDNDPVIGMSDLLIHLASDQLSKKASEVIEGEDLNALVGSIPSKGVEKDGTKATILAILNDKYGMEEDDFISAELSIVPSGKARDYGLDRSMVLGYGHDDRICAYTSLIAQLECDHPVMTTCTILVDKEEVGSQGNTGMSSRFFENTLVDVMESVCGYQERKYRAMLSNSKMLSSDVTAAFDPNFPGVYEKKNTAYMGMGLSFSKYTGVRGKSGSNDANAEFIAEIRAIMDKHNVQIQTAELGKVDQGGGGTIAYILANLNMDVIDAGIPVQNMHAPYEVASKADIFEAYRGYLAFLQLQR